MEYGRNKNNNNNLDYYLNNISGIENDVSNDNKVVINRKKKSYYNSQSNFGGYNSDIVNDQKFAEYFNKNLIQKKEIKSSQIKDSMNLMRETSLKKKKKEINRDLKYVKEKK